MQSAEKRRKAGAQDFTHCGRVKTLNRIDPGSRRTPRLRFVERPRKHCAPHRRCVEEAREKARFSDSGFSGEQNDTASSLGFRVL